MDRFTASSKLSQMELAFSLGELRFSVLWFRVMQMPQKWVINRHTHSSYEFHFVAFGACRVQLDNRTFVARTGEFYLTAPGVYHQQSSFGAAGYTEYSINYDVSGTPAEDTEESCLMRTLHGAPCRAVPDTGGCIALFERALQEADRQPFGYYNSVRCLAMLLWITAARSINGNGEYAYAVPRKKKADDQRFFEMAKFIEDNAALPLCAGDLSNHFYLSDRQISRIIKNRTGMPTKSYINSIRLKKSKALLRETGLSLREIAERLGFSSEYYFSQFFKREEGDSPGTFRSNVQKT